MFRYDDLFDPPKVCKTMGLMLNSLTESMGEDELRNLVRNHNERKGELQDLEREVEQAECELQKFQVGNLFQF